MTKKLILGMSLLLLIVAASSCKKKEHERFGDIYGIVSDAVTHDPIAGAHVTINPGGRSQVTGSDGRFEFKDLDPQQYTITAQRTGYQTNRRTITAIVGETIEVNIPLTTNP